MDQAEEISVFAKREGSQIHITVKTDKLYTIRLVNVTAASVSEGGLQHDGHDTVLQGRSFCHEERYTVTL